MEAAHDRGVHRAVGGKKSRVMYPPLTLCNNGGIWWSISRDAAGIPSYLMAAPPTTFVLCTFHQLKGPRPHNDRKHRKSIGQRS
jgi:hypothetical protein